MPLTRFKKKTPVNILSRTKVFIISTLLLIVFYIPIAQSATVTELKNRIEDKNKEIEKIEAEIKEYEKQIANNSSKSKTLKVEIERLELTRKKLLSEITLTERKINESSVTITKLAEEINKKEKNIATLRDSMAEIMRVLDEEGSPSLLEITLKENRFSDFFNAFEEIESFDEKIQTKLAELRSLRKILDSEKETEETEKKNFENYKSQLSDQKKLTEFTKKTTNSLLKNTQNQETVYKKLLTEQLNKKNELEKEIADYESQIKVIIDPSTLPLTGQGILSWPLDKVVITQYFGNTAFATKNAQIYNGKGHNGIDLGISEGTIVKSAAKGVVVGTGDTDKACMGASYGKWVLVEHLNGLSTLYAHLSIIKTQAGAKLERGDSLGYSGSTGYSTGPHLHFTVYASKGVSIQSLKSKVRGCGVYILPVASQSSYLNPLSYL